MLTREQILIVLSAMLVAGLTGGGVVALAVRDEDKARELAPVPEQTLIHPTRGHSETNNPASALLEVWSSAQWGDIPAILRLQDPAMRRALGDTVITGVYQHQRERMVTRRPRVASAEVTGSTATVRYRVQGEPRTTPPQLAIMRRCRQSWCVRYDTFIEEALPFYVIAVNGGEVKPRRADRLAGASTAAVYRGQAAHLALLPPRKDTR